MIATLLFVAFLGLMFVGVPIGAALGLAGAAAIALANADSGLACWLCRRTSTLGWANTRCWPSRCSCW